MWQSPTHKDGDCGMNMRYTWGMLGAWLMLAKSLPIVLCACLLSRWGGVQLPIWLMACLGCSMNVWVGHMRQVAHIGLTTWLLQNWQTALYINPYTSIHLAIFDVVCPWLMCFYFWLNILKICRKMSFRNYTLSKDRNKNKHWVKLK